jgi:TPR repeat protein
LACDAGLAVACGSLAECFMSGTGVPKDEVNALMLFEQSCEGGDAEGCHRAASAHARGKRPEDRRKADSYYGLACRGGWGKGCEAKKR